MRSLVARVVVPLGIALAACSAGADLEADLKGCEPSTPTRFEAQIRAFHLCDSPKPGVLSNPLFPSDAVFPDLQSAITAIVLGTHAQPGTAGSGFDRVDPEVRERLTVEVSRTAGIVSVDILLDGERWQPSDIGEDLDLHLEYVEPIRWTVFQEDVLALDPPFCFPQRAERCEIRRTDYINNFVLSEFAVDASCFPLRFWSDPECQPP